LGQLLKTPYNILIETIKTEFKNTSRVKDNINLWNSKSLFSETTIRMEYFYAGSNMIKDEGMRISGDKIISKRLAEELQRMKEISRTLQSRSEYVSVRILRDTPSLREYKLMIAFSRYSKPRLNGKVVIIKLTLPEEFPKAKPRIEISNVREDIDLNLRNYLENLPPLRDWSPNRHLFEVALSILEFFDNFAPTACPICLNKITAQEYENSIQCRNPRCLSLYHKNCFESWISRGYKRACVFCDTPI
jgi:ubiquitin-protein ligase